MRCRACPYVGVGDSFVEMGGVDSTRRSSGGGAGAARGDDGLGTPGKTTLTAALGPGAAPADVNATARAQAAPAFGAAAHGVHYAVGEGAAEARGANAVTTAGRVDFAPGKLDLVSDLGRARLGEETAHAVQQSNRGEPGTVASLEGEAKQAGLDFASGRAPRVELAAPSGLALADDPKDRTTALKDTDPSPEVPDLQQGEVVAIKKVIASDQTTTLTLLLKALQRIDATTFAATDLTGHALDTKGGGSMTRQGPGFQAWLETYLDGVATKASKTRDKLTKDEVKKAIAAAAPPAGKKDIEVRIGSAHFASVSLLYSSVRHEFIHVQQLRKDYLVHLPSSVMPSGVDAPDSGKVINDREVEAYLWEMEHLARTGLTDAGELHLLWESCSNAYLNASTEGTKTYKARFEAAFTTVWKKAMDGHIAAIAVLHAELKKVGSVAEPGNVELLRRHMQEMWINRNRFVNMGTAYDARHTTALAQGDEMIASIKSDKLKKALDQADLDLKTGYTAGDDAYAAWDDLTTRWINLEVAAQKPLEARFKITDPALWDQAFTLYEAEVRKRIKDGDPEVAQELLDHNIDTLFRNAGTSFVKVATYTARRDALKAEVKKASKKP
jgi:Domain of unknown function (DUF4157)